MVGCTTSDNRVLWKKGIKAELEEHRLDIRKANVVFLNVCVLFSESSREKLGRHSGGV